MSEPAKFDVVLELTDLSQNSLEVRSSSLLAFLEGVKTAYADGCPEGRVPDPAAGGDYITLNFHLVVDRSDCGAGAGGDGEEERTLLTRRQTEIAHLLERGLTNKEIANKLNISPATVKNHVHAILGKLDLDRRSKVAAYLRSRSQLVVSAQGAGASHGASQGAGS
jgi:DNA-binding CsgD family transcriptional regulator